MGDLDGGKTKSHLREGTQFFYYPNPNIVPILLIEIFSLLTRKNVRGSDN